MNEISCGEKYYYSKVFHNRVEPYGRPVLILSQCKGILLGIKN